MNGLSCLLEGEECVWISDVARKTFVSVDEAGTEAPAATAVVVGVTEAEPETPMEVTIDRPFVFLVRDCESEAVLFVGRVVRP